MFEAQFPVKYTLHSTQRICVQRHYTDSDKPAGDRLVIGQIWVNPDQFKWFKARLWPFLCVMFVWCLLFTTLRKPDTSSLTHNADRLPMVKPNEAFTVKRQVVVRCLPSFWCLWNFLYGSFFLEAHSFQREFDSLSSEQDYEVRNFLVVSFMAENWIFSKA